MSGGLAKHDERLVRRRWALLVVLAVGLAGGILAAVLLRGPGERAVTPPPPAERMLVGFLDDASFRWHPARTQMLDRVHATGARLVRAFIRWHLAAPVRPAEGALPFDEPRLYELDELVSSAQARGLDVLFTVWGTPEWANGGQPPNRAPTDPGSLRDFVHALAARYPAVRRYSIWNEPNTELFLAPQFDAQGRSVAPQTYAALYRAAYEGIKAANPDALVAAGETSSHGRDTPSLGRVQDSHSPARFAELLAARDPGLELDAWAHHPYPTRPRFSPEHEALWPSVGLTSVERFGRSLDEWFGHTGIPLWLTEFAYEAAPAERAGLPAQLHAEYAARAVELAAASPRVRMFVWFTFADCAGNRWQSGLLDETGSKRPAYAAFGAAVRALAVRPALSGGSGGGG